MMKIPLREGCNRKRARNAPLSIRTLYFNGTYAEDFVAPIPRLPILSGGSEMLT